MPSDSEPLKPAAPLAYPGFVPPSPEMPGSIKTLAVLSIVMGCLGTFCCGLFTLGSVTMNGAQGIRAPDGTVLVAQSSVPNGVILTLAVASAQFVASAALLMAGFGALSLKRWSRPLAVGISWVLLLVAIVRLTGSILYGPETEALFKQTAAANDAWQKKNPTKGDAEPPPTMTVASFTSGGSIITGTILFLLNAMVPALVLIYWTRPAVKAVFTAGGIAPNGSSAPPPPEPSTSDEAIRGL